MAIPEILQEFGHDPEAIFDGTDLKPAQFADPDTVVPYLAADMLLARCVAATGCQHFGLLVGTHAGPSSLGVAGFMLQSAPDVGTGLRDLVQHLDLHDRGGVPTLLTRGNTTRLGYAIYQPGTKATDQINDLAIAIGCNIMRSLCGEKWNPTEVLLSHRAPRDLEPYRGLFRAPLHFDADQNAVIFPSRWLDHRIPGADPLLHRHLEREAAVLHEFRKVDIVSELRGLLRKSLITGKCTAGDIALQLCVHERTLNRRLREEGTSFHQELDNIRYEVARQYLAESTMPITRIATALNYSDVSTFSRAFKRWAGTTPAEWRNRIAAP